MRVPAHKIALNLIRRAGPLATTSANVSGMKSLVKIKNIGKKLFSQVDLTINGGPASAKKESTIIDFSTQKPKVLRRGSINCV